MDPQFSLLLSPAEIRILHAYLTTGRSDDGLLALIGRMERWLRIMGK